MLIEVMREVNNFFEISAERGEFSLARGRICLNGDYRAGQYIAVTGSVFNNGVYKIEKKVAPCHYFLSKKLMNETFNGIIYGLAIPNDFIALVKDIEENIKKTSESTYVSEKFTDYSYSRATDKNGLPLAWQAIFSKRLSNFRKMFSEVKF